MEPLQAIQDAAAGEFHKLCRLKLGQHDVFVYVSHVRESEWGLRDMMGLFARTQKSKKQGDRFRGAWETVQTYHELMWPGVGVSLLDVKFSEKHDSDQTSWLSLRTIPTSGLFAYFAYCCNYSYKTNADRAAAWGGMTKLMGGLHNCLGSFTVTFTRCGRLDGVSGDLEVDSQGHVFLSQFFTRAFWLDHAKTLWKNDLKDGKKSWIHVHATHSEECKISLADLLVFLLDPQHPRSFMDLAAPRAFELLTEIAYLVDDHVEDMSSDTRGFDSGCKRKRASSAEMQYSVQEIAKKLWSGSVAWSNRAAIFLCLCV